LIEFDDGDCGWYDLRNESKRGHLRWGEPHLLQRHPHREDGRGGRRLRGGIGGKLGEVGEVRGGNMREDVVGARVRVYWDGDAEWFAGTIGF